MQMQLTIMVSIVFLQPRKVYIMWAQCAIEALRCASQSSDMLLLVMHRWCTRWQIMARVVRGPVHRRAYSMGLYALSCFLVEICLCETAFTLYN